MITFESMNCKNFTYQFETGRAFNYSKKSDFKQLLTNISTFTQSKLPHSLLDIGTGSSDGPDFQSSYNKKPKSALVKTLSAPTKYMSNEYLAWDLEFTLKAGIFAGAYWEKSIDRTKAYQYAKQFVHQFMNGKGEKWYDDGGLSNVIKKSPEGQKLIRKISEEFGHKMRINQGDFSRIKLDKTSYKKLSFSWKSSPTLKILVGGTQKLTVTLSAIFYFPKTCNWSAFIDVEIRDDFGVTESDITKASPSAKLGIGGLIDMWVLQKQRGKKPFTSVFNFSFFCFGGY